MAGFHVPDVIHQGEEGLAGMTYPRLVVVWNDPQDQGIVDDTPAHIAVMYPIDVDVAVYPFKVRRVRGIRQRYIYPQFQEIFRSEILTIQAVRHPSPAV